MKKKTFGRVAAIGLAGLAVVPAFSIVASADVAYDSASSSISGTAYRISWTVSKTDTTCTADVVENYATGKLSVTFRNSSVFTTPLTETDDINVEDGTAPAEKGAGSVYVTTNAQAVAMQGNITSAISAQSRYADNDLNGWKKEWNDYVKNYNDFITAKGALSEKVTEKTFTDTTGTEVTVNAESVNPYTAPTAKDCDYYKYSCTPVIETKTMKQIADEISNTVKITNGVIEKGKDYSVNTSGSSNTTGSTGTVTGTYGSYYVPAGSSTSTPAVSYYSNELGYYFPSVAALRSVVGYTTNDYSRRAIPDGFTFSTDRRYFNPINGYYYTYSSDASTYGVYVYSSTTNEEYGIYKVSPSGLYYYTYSSALSAAGNDAGRVSGPTRTFSSLTAQGNYFSRLTGGFYATYSEALAYSGGNSSYVITINAVADNYYYDPYYYYFMNKNNNSSSSSSSSSSNLGGSSVTIGNKSGWSSVQSSIKNASVGTTLNVSMGSETSIPQEILSALNGKNVTVNFTLRNGAVISFNGADISNPRDINVGVVYNTYNISNNLINKAKSVNNAVSSAQISINGNTFGGSASLTVKFNASRAGYNAKIYRYNSSRSSLQLVDTAKVSGNGKVTFDKVTQGGEFVIVLY